MLPLCLALQLLHQAALFPSGQLVDGLLDLKLPLPEREVFSHNSGSSNVVLLDHGGDLLLLLDDKSLQGAYLVMHLLLGMVFECHFGFKPPVFALPLPLPLLQSPYLNLVLLDQL